MTSAWKRCMDCENEFIFKPWFGWDIELLMPGTQKRLLHPYRGMTPYQKRNRVKRKSKKEPWKNVGEKFYQSWNTFEHYLDSNSRSCWGIIRFRHFFNPNPFHAACTVTDVRTKVPIEKKPSIGLLDREKRPKNNVYCTCACVCIIAWRKSIAIYLS